MAVKRKRKAMPALVDGAAMLLAKALERRVIQLEGRVESLAEDQGTLFERLDSLRTAVRQVEDRQLRGERILMELQADQQRCLRALERISGALKISPTVVPSPKATPPVLGG